MFSMLQPVGISHLSYDNYQIEHCYENILQDENETYSDCLEVLQIFYINMLDIAHQDRFWFTRNSELSELLVIPLDIFLEGMHVVFLLLHNFHKSQECADS